MTRNLTTTGDAPMDQPELHHPWGIVSPSFWAGAETAPQAPPAVPRGLAAIHAASVAGRHEDALLLAEELDAQLTAAHGEVSLDTIQVREVRGYLTDLAGRAPEALEWYLHALRLRARLHGPDSPDTEAAARRAYSLWRTLPPAGAQDAAPALLAALTEAQGPDSRAARRTRRRSAELAAGA
ncbi:tetratricopeptide repeat protein [Streptomyces sp. WAC07061]|uniref:tetratricopeptide repeat protein n=1 Tax=Streptomyces sp. WAC07061 TaxID=2487410 RepID=UPI000F785D39|nr:tetratricopeptide repeat protein [Streptomyces sp. WAC07061]RSS42988.1 tetratricopeptide repeat protein [Streptomyces sp. WAC07061]